MKKLLTIMLALVMVLSLSVTAFAADNSINQGSANQAGNTTVTFNVDPTYTVTIPATVTLAKDEESGSYKQDATITATGVRLLEGKVINVTLSGDFTLTAGTTDWAYTVTVGSDPDPIATDAIVATFDTDPAEQTSVLHFAAENPTYAGNYSDTVTFTIAVVTQP